MVMQVPGLSQGAGSVELTSFKPWNDWEHKEGPNRYRERERASLRKMMYMWGQKRIDQNVDKEEKKAEIKVKKTKKRTQQNPKPNYCKEEVTMVIRRVLGSSYKFQSKKEKQKMHGQTKQTIPPLVGSNEIPKELPKKKGTSERKQKEIPRKATKQQRMDIEKGALRNRVSNTKEGINIMPGDFQGGGPSPGTSSLQVANQILLI